MKRLAFVLLCSACDGSQLDFPVQPAGGTAGQSGSFAPDLLPDAGMPGDGGTLGDGGVGGIDGGPISDAGGLGPDGAVQLDSGIIEFFDASVPPAP